jgi:histidinol dehydrogenase
MSAIPARVAGVREITLATPLAGNQSDDNLLAAAHLAGVTSILNAGGAQAIAAMAYGTKSVSRVDKIVGPGNIYVACAKRLVFGAVAIDSIAGPSEILVIADNESDPEIVAADLLSQAEHDEDAYPLLVCLSEGFAQEVQKCLEQQLAGLPREAIARASVERNGIAFVVESRHRLVEVADAIAAEHLAIHAAEPDWLLQNIDRAGAVFLGTSHVLPTGGAVRFGSPLGVYDFITRSSIIRYSREALTRHARAISDFARLEGLEAHARAVTVRLRDGR